MSESGRTDSTTSYGSTLDYGSSMDYGSTIGSNNVTLRSSMTSSTVTSRSSADGDADSLASEFILVPNSQVNQSIR